MPTNTYLITGATGSTGSDAVDLMLSHGLKVRALVHKEDKRSDALKKKGAEIVVGELKDFASVRAALEGIDSAYFVYPIMPDLIEVTSYFAQAAKEAGVKAIVNMSQISARREAKSHAAFNHWIAERIFEWSGTPTVHLRPTFFAEWLIYPNHIKDVKNGVVELGFTNGKHAPIAAYDQARIIAAILEKPAAHLGKTYPLFGPTEYTPAELYAEVSRVLGKTLTYKTVSNDQVREKFARWYHPFIAQHIAEVTKDHTAGVFSGTDSIIEKVTGKRPLTVAEFIERNRPAFLKYSFANE